MSESTVDTNTAESSPSSVSKEALPIASAPSKPGAILRAAREAAGLSQSEISQTIRFSVRQIEALERDDYESLPGSTVVRGFIRGYAKYLHLEVEPLLAALNPVMPVADAEVREPSNMGEAGSPGVTDRLPIRLISAVIIGISVVLMVAWYLISLSDGNTDGTTVAAPAKSMAPQDTAVAPPVVVPVAADSVAVTVSGASDSVPGDPASASSPLSPPPPLGLRLEFDDRSWVEVRDTTQNIVYSGEKPAGTRQNISGKGPFYLWIGKASGVRVFFGERSIDLRPYTREDVARLTVE